MEVLRVEGHWGAYRGSFYRERMRGTPTVPPLFGCLVFFGGFGQGERGD
jgi:hypothetical protein